MCAGGEVEGNKAMATEGGYKLYLGVDRKRNGVGVTLSMCIVELQSVKSVMHVPDKQDVR